MTEVKTNDRIAFLAEKFDIYEDDVEATVAKAKSLEEAGYTVTTITRGGNLKNPTLAFVSTKTEKKKGDKDRLIKKISIGLSVFTEMIKADPTSNKSCVQWMLNVFTRLVTDNRSESIAAAKRFVIEDLPQAREYIALFEGNKRKNKFRELCKSSYSLMKVADPTDINQYKDLSQLFDAVDPFIEKEPSDMERLLNRFVEAKQAVIPVRDRKFTLYIPKSLAASVAFNGFANWCTTRPGNSNFGSYTGQLTSLGKNSNLYIIINNKFFTGESQELYQIHFESDQIKDRLNSQNVSIFEAVLRESEGISNFFYEELMKLAKACKTGIDNNNYLEYLIKFGFTESIFEIIDENIPTIKFMSNNEKRRDIPKVPDLSRFKNLEQLIITNANLVELHPSIGKLDKLEILVITENKVKSIPKEIGNLKRLAFLNLNGNPIVDFPEELKYLDRGNGGSLCRISVKKAEVGEENYQKLKRWLPNTQFSSNDKSSN